jgi:UDP-3-O-[3-hydroxymyristoyl] glucosamine N-acyltransferase
MTVSNIMSTQNSNEKYIERGPTSSSSSDGREATLQSLYSNLHFELSPKHIAEGTAFIAATLLSAYFRHPDYLKEEEKLLKRAKLLPPLTLGDDTADGERKTEQSFREIAELNTKIRALMGEGNTPSQLARTNAIAADTTYLKKLFGLPERIQDKGEILSLEAKPLQFAKETTVSTGDGTYRVGEGSSIHPTAIIAKGAVIGRGVEIKAGVEIGASSIIGNGAVIEAGAQIGQKVRLLSLGQAKQESVWIREKAIIGDQVIIEPKCMIGALVEIADLVKIGEGTRIFPHSKVGKLSQIGAFCTLADRSFIGPSCKLGLRVSVGDEAALHPNVTLDDDAKIATGAIIGSYSDIGPRTKIGAWALVRERVLIGADVFLAGREPKENIYLPAAKVGINSEIGDHSQIFGEIGNNVICEHHVKIYRGSKVGDRAHLNIFVQVGTEKRTEEVPNGTTIEAFEIFPYTRPPNPPPIPPLEPT